MSEMQIDQDLDKLIQEELSHLLDDVSTDNTGEEERIISSNVYFDKQLSHLVVTEQFNFKSISVILSTFSFYLGQLFEQDKVETSERACRERWAFIHRNRSQMALIKEKQMEDKRARSVASFSNPFSLYSVDELIENLQKVQKQKSEKNEFFPKVEEPASKGYNIMKDSFRKVVNKDQHIQLEQKMQRALQKAQQQVFEEKPLYFTPNYKSNQSFQIESQELTSEKVKQLMAFQIEMDKIEREIAIRKQEKEQEKYESMIRKRLQKQQKAKKEKRGEMDDDWDEYESD